MKRKKPGPAKGQKHIDIKRSPFGERLFRARKARGFSQQELGEKANLSKRMVSRYEGAFAGPPMETLTNLAQALNVTVSYLLGESTLKINNDEVKPNIRKHIDTLQNLPPKDQKKVLEYTDLLGSANNKK